MKKYTVTSVFFLMLFWHLLAVWMNNDFLFPYPKQVIETMVQQVTDPIFYESIAQTLLRSTIGLAAAFLLAFICSMLSFQSSIFRNLFYPILLLTRSVPNICFVILIILWFGSDVSAAIVNFLIIFPTAYSSLYSGLHHIDPTLKNVIRMYPEKNGYLIWKIYIPLIQEAIQASLSNGISLAFKVGVMSEIVGQVQVGIGRQLNICRLTPDMAGIFAWTGWIILILVCLDGFIQLIYHKKNLPKI